MSSQQYSSGGPFRWFAFSLGLFCLLALPALAADDAALRAFARRVGLSDLDGFVATVQSLDRTGRLPLPVDELAAFVGRFVVCSLASDEEIARRVLAVRLDPTPAGTPA